MRRLLFAGLVFPLPLLGQSTGRPLVGYAAASAAAERTVEAAALTTPSADSARAHSRALSRETHVAGTPAQERTRDYVVDAMRRWGLTTKVSAYRVWMPHATGVHVSRIAPGGDSIALSLAEPALPEDATSGGWQYPTVNGYSAAGDAAGEVVYVNYGLIEDYAQLDSMGVSVRGKVAVARYGRSFRGIKAREAEKRGAVALVIYSDPADDGFVRGDVYPEGPMRPSFGVQRGSVFNGNGDPSTPGWASTERARRVPLDSMGVPGIPVVPMSYGNAARLLEGVRGASVPQSWQGGLPFRYHAGPGPVRARVRVETDAATNGWKTIYNTIATVRGSEYPDEVVVIGAHRDGWSPGTQDNVSGTVSVLEAARAVAAQLRMGRRPKRTLVFATWDAEEWGLLGSTEFVEQDSLRLVRGGVAYLNQDVAASGPRFGAGGSPSLRAALREVAKDVPDPSGAGSVYAAWRRSSSTSADSVEPLMGDPGGGSDFAGFYNHLGIPHSDWGFGAAGGVYHSQYDSFDWMRRFGDSTFVYHATAAQLGTLMMLRLANADVIPYDYVEFARTLRRYVPLIDRAIDAARLRTASTQLGPTPAPATQAAWSSVRATPIDEALDRMERAAADFATVRDMALTRSNAPSRTALVAANDALRQVERALTRPQGLRTRPWFRTLVYAADEDNGYSTVVFPSVAEAIRGGDAVLAGREVSDLAARLEAATQALRKAERALR